MSNIKRYVDGDRTLMPAMLVGTVIGALLGIAVFGRNFILPQWQQVMAPPEKAVELLAYHNNAFDDNTLYIRTISGNIYAVRSSSYSASDVDWRKVEQVDQKESSYECKLGEFSTPNPPGRIVSRLESHPCIEDAESQVNYIILEDGSIWKWERTTGELDLLLIPIGVVYAGIGGALGGVAGMLIGLVALTLKKK